MAKQLKRQCLDTIAETSDFSVKR